jgi:hypothetical protein
MFRATAAAEMESPFALHHRAQIASAAAPSAHGCIPHGDYHAPLSVCGTSGVPETSQSCPTPRAMRVAASMRLKLQGLEQVDHVRLVGVDDDHLLSELGIAFEESAKAMIGG